MSKRVKTISYTKRITLDDADKLWTINQAAAINLGKSKYKGVAKSRCKKGHLFLSKTGICLNCFIPYREGWELAQLIEDTKNAG